MSANAELQALTAILSWLTSLLALVPGATALWNALTAKKTLIEQIIAEGRNPTDAEWDQLNADTATKEAMIDELTHQRTGE